jgi:hypothetical protein
MSSPGGVAKGLTFNVLARAAALLILWLVLAGSYPADLPVGLVAVFAATLTGFMSTCSRASGSLATFTSHTILPVSSTMQMLVSLTETSSPAKWSMLRFSF